MINLLPREDLFDVRMERIKNYVKLGTTVLLVTYLLIVTTIVIWWIYLTQNQNLAVRRMEDLLKQLSGLGNKEILYLNLVHRVSVVDKSISSHSLVSKQLTPLLDSSVGVVITGYSWNSSSIKQKLILKASNPLLLERYIDTLKTTFKKVTLEEFRLYTAPDWTATISVE